MAIVDIKVYGAKAVADRLKRMPRNLDTLEKSFWHKKMNTYKIYAKWLILNVVYGAYSPRVYERTMKLRDSIKTEKIPDGMWLYQDSAVTPPKLSGKYPSYAHYFIYGGGFLAMKNAVPIRDFLGAWHRFFNRKFRSDYNDEVVRPALETCMSRYEIKIVSRNRATGEKIASVAPESIARAIYGDPLIDAVIARGKVENTLLKRENAGK